MCDREKVIKGLEILHANSGCIAPYDCDCKTCPYERVNGCIDAIIVDALALLKAQEQKPISASIVDSDSGLMHWWACGNCQAPINPEDKFCHECGRAVKWDE